MMKAFALGTAAVTVVAAEYIQCPPLYFPFGVSPAACDGIGDCKIHCESGYQAVAGRSTLTCNAGEWSGQPLVCAEVIATAGAPLPGYENRLTGNGYNKRRKMACPDLYFGEGHSTKSCEGSTMCNLSCQDGFRPVYGEETLACNFQTGEWSGPPLVCAKKEAKTKYGPLEEDPGDATNSWHGRMVEWHARMVDDWQKEHGAGSTPNDAEHARFISNYGPNDQYGRMNEEDVIAAAGYHKFDRYGRLEQEEGQQGRVTEEDKPETGRVMGDNKFDRYGRLEQEEGQQGRVTEEDKPETGRLVEEDMFEQGSTTTPAFLVTRYPVAAARLVEAATQPDFKKRLAARIDERRGRGNRPRTDRPTDAPFAEEGN